MRQCRIIIKRLGGLGEKRADCANWHLRNQPECCCLGPVLYVGVLEECPLLVEHSRSPGRQKKLWKMGGLNLSVSEVRSLSRTEGSEILTVRASLESQLDCPCTSRDTADRRERAVFSNHLHSLPGTYFGSGSGCHPLPASVYSYKEMALLGTTSPGWGCCLCGLDFCYHCLYPLNFPASGLSLLLPPGFLCLSSPYVTCWILLSVYVPDHKLPWLAA